MNEYRYRKQQSYRGETVCPEKPETIFSRAKQDSATSPT
ncbi:hypothetical protein OROGR_004571 [Orobanche gracilis]